MARNGSGTYSLPSGNPVVTGTTISSSTHNTTMSDIATALTASLAKDGQTSPTANLPMGGYKHTGVAASSAVDHYARTDQVQNGSFNELASVAGTDTITGSATPTPAAYAAGQMFAFIAAATNTGAATLNVSSLGAKAITKNGTTALAAGDIPSGAAALVRYDGTQFQLLNVAIINSAKTDVANTFTAAQTFSAGAAFDKGADIASANPLVLGTDGSYFDVTGTTNFASITVAAGTLFMLQFDGVLTMTHNGTTLDLPGEADITTAAGDKMLCYATAANQVDVIAYTRADGTAIAASTFVASKAVNATRDLTTASGTQSITGAGFTPTSVTVVGVVAAAAGGSVGLSDGTNQLCLWNNNTAPSSSATYSLIIQSSGGNYQTGTIAMTADGCDVTWTKTASPTGTANITFIFHR